ncbi:MAG: carboxypeptidase-like regulatory domain-containing protein [Ignavibacteriales bacterium]|nr:carboxypeptidase-like regulatory domain-containing protein [Ignavibacteriales bacterium]
MGASFGRRRAPIITRQIGDTILIPEFPRPTGERSVPIGSPIPTKSVTGISPMWGMGRIGSYGGIGRFAHLLRRRPAYRGSVTKRTGTTMDASIAIRHKGGGENRSKQATSSNIIQSGVISPCPSRGPAPYPAATRGGSLQARKSRQPGHRPARGTREQPGRPPQGLRSGTRRNHENSQIAWRRWHVAVLLLAGVLSAQAPTAGRITGTVMDDQGAPLPGVSVEAKSPRLVGIGGRPCPTRTASTASSPSRRALYTITFSLQGFSAVVRERHRRSASNRPWPSTSR